ncbi:unnamed protein product, partial [Closterium sp. NIES-53]
ASVTRRVESLLSGQRAYVGSSHPSSGSTRLPCRAGAMRLTGGTRGGASLTTTSPF